MEPEIIPAYEYFFVFWHYKDNELRNGKRCGTICQLLAGDDVVTQGEAVLRPDERYDPVIGRQVALSRALQAYPDETAGLFWQIYYDHYGAKEYQRYMDFMKV